MDRSNLRKDTHTIVPTEDMTVEEYIKTVLDTRITQLMEHADNRIAVRTFI